MARIARSALGTFRSSAALCWNQHVVPRIQEQWLIRELVGSTPIGGQRCPNLSQTIQTIQTNVRVQIPTFVTRLGDSIGIKKLHKLNLNLPVTSPRSRAGSRSWRKVHPHIVMTWKGPVVEKLVAKKVLVTYVKAAEDLDLSPLPLPLPWWQVLCCTRLINRRISLL